MNAIMSRWRFTGSESAGTEEVSSSKPKSRRARRPSRTSGGVREAKLEEQGDNRHDGQVAVRDLNGELRGLRAGPEEVSTMMARWPFTISTVSFVVFEPGPRR
eukprot:9254215-Heterocapsa_arctica.AAC.1